MSQRLFLLDQRCNDGVSRNLKADIEGVVLAIQPALGEKLRTLAVSNAIDDMSRYWIIEGNDPLVSWVVSGTANLSALLVSGIKRTEVMTHFSELHLLLLLVGSYCYLVNREFHDEQTGSAEGYG